MTLTERQRKCPYTIFQEPVKNLLVTPPFSHRAVELDHGQNEEQKLEQHGYNAGAESIDGSIL